MLQIVVGATIMLIGIVIGVVMGFGLASNKHEHKP